MPPDRVPLLWSLYSGLYYLRGALETCSSAETLQTSLSLRHKGTYGPFMPSSVIASSQSFAVSDTFQILMAAKAGMLPGPPLAEHAQLKTYLLASSEALHGVQVWGSPVHGKHGGRLHWGFATFHAKDFWKLFYSDLTGTEHAKLFTWCTFLILSDQRQSPRSTPVDGLLCCSRLSLSGAMIAMPCMLRRG